MKFVNEFKQDELVLLKDAGLILVKECSVKSESPDLKLKTVNYH